MESDKKPCHAFFLATKNNKKVVIYYPDPYRDGQDGMPNVVIKVTDADKLYQKFKERFWKDYDNADAVKRQTEQNEELMRKKLKGM